MEKAAHHFADAAAQAAKALAFDRAARLYRMALDLSNQEVTVERKLRTQLGNSLANLGRGAEAAHEYLLAAVNADTDESIDLQRRAAALSLINGRLEEGLSILRTVSSRVGLRLPKSSKTALWSLLLRRFLLALRGLNFVERPSDRVPPDVLRRINVCYTGAAALSFLEPLQAACLQTRGLLLALKAGEPYHIACSLASEAQLLSTLGNSERSARLLLIADRLARRDGHSHAIGLVSMAAGYAALQEGRWKKAREFSEQAEIIFREQCVDAAWEIHAARGSCFWALLSLGDFRELAHRANLLSEEQQVRKDLFLLTNQGVFIRPLASMAVDDLPRARTELEQLIQQLPQRGFQQPHFLAMIVQGYLDLYQHEGEVAWNRLQPQWCKALAARIFRFQLARILGLHLHAGCALAAATKAVNPESYLCIAERDAARLKKEKALWAQPLVHLILGSVAAGRGDLRCAIMLLRQAIEGFDRVDMAHYSAAARWRLGGILGNSEGQSSVEEANSWLDRQRLPNVSRMLDILAPGFPNQI